MFTPNEYGLFSMPTLETPRLILRRMTMKDAKDIFEYSRDEEVACHVLWSAQRDIVEAKDYCRYMLRRYRADEPSSWGIIDRQTRHLVGTIGYMDYSMDNASVEIGYSLARWLWNGGYMTEALRAMVQNAFEVMNVEAVAISHFVGNEPSRKVIERAGFIFEGVMPCGFKRFDGEIFDNVCYSILRSEYDTGLISSVRRMR